VIKSISGGSPTISKIKIKDIDDDYNTKELNSGTKYKKSKTRIGNKNFKEFDDGSPTLEGSDNKFNNSNYGQKNIIL